MNLSMTKAWLIGLLILLIAFAVWSWLLTIETFSMVAALLLWISPGVAAFVTAYLGPAKKIFPSVTLAIPAAILALLLNVYEQALGHEVDFPGVKGGVSLLLIVLVFSAILAGIGGFAGSKCSLNPEI